MLDSAPLGGIRTRVNLRLRVFRRDRVSESDRDRLRELVEGRYLALTGTESDDGEEFPAGTDGVETPETGSTEPIQRARPGRFERPTSRSGGERSIH
jgi:hypothetical protein